MNLKIINTETGEIMDEIAPGDRILRKRSIDFLKSKEEDKEELIEINIGRGFIKIYEDIIEDVIEAGLGASTFLVIMICLKYLSYVSGAIRYPKGGHFLTPSDFVKETGLSRSTVFREIDRLVEEGFLHKGKVEEEYQLFANPYVFMKGRRINRTLFDMFKNSKWHRKHKRDVKVDFFD